MIFGVGQILFTATVTAVLVAAAGWWRLGRPWWDVAAVGMVSGVAAAVWRLAANMSPLNDDGLPGVSANDLAAPIAVFVALSVYADLRAPGDPRRYRQVRALATLLAIAVNVITI